MKAWPDHRCWCVENYRPITAKHGLFCRRNRPRRNHETFWQWLRVDEKRTFQPLFGLQNALAASWDVQGLRYTMRITAYHSWLRGFEVFLDKKLCLLLKNVLKCCQLTIFEVWTFEDNFGLHSRNSKVTAAYNWRRYVHGCTDICFTIIGALET